MHNRTLSCVMWLQAPTGPVSCSHEVFAFKALSGPSEHNYTTGPLGHIFVLTNLNGPMHIQYLGTDFFTRPFINIKNIYLLTNLNGPMHIQYMGTNVFSDRTM